MRFIQYCERLLSVSHSVIDPLRKASCELLPNSPSARLQTVILNSLKDGVLIFRLRELYPSASADEIPSSRLNAPIIAVDLRVPPLSARLPGETTHPTPRKRSNGPPPRRSNRRGLLSGGRAGRRAVEEAGFSNELKSRLLEKLADAKFQSDNAATLAEAGVGDRINSAAGEGTRHIAASQPWTGEESHEDAVLRMLNDARKPLAPGLRGKAKIPQPSVPVDMRMRREAAVSRGQRAASARDKAQVYAGMGMKETGLSDEEREAVRREFRERFTPGARAMPSTISGLAALANERIEDAIARGQFKNIPRGKGIERDARADNPFIDTVSSLAFMGSPG